MAPRVTLLMGVLMLLLMARVYSHQIMVPPPYVSLTVRGVESRLYLNACVVCSSRFSAIQGVICCTSPVCDSGSRWQCTGYPDSTSEDDQEFIKHKRALGISCAGHRSGEKREEGMAAVPWQTLWLLQSSERECGYQEAFLRFGQVQNLKAVDWFLKRPEEPIGHCPIRFRPYVDPHRWLPRNLVVSECICEGSPCTRHGSHVCVTVFAVRSVYSLYTGKKRVLIAVGCLCALANTKLAKVYSPQTVPVRR